MAHTVDRVEKWLARQHEKGSVATVQIHRTGNGQLLESCVFRGGMETEEFARDIFDQMEQDADANEPGQPGKYTLSLFFKGEEDAAPLTLGMSVMGADNEPPSMEDQFTGQALRHQEANMQTAMHGPELALSEMRTMLTMVVSQNKELMSQRMEELLQMRKIILDQQEIEIAREKAKSEAYIWSKVIEQAEVFVPMVVGQLMKKKPEKGDEPKPPELQEIVEVKLILDFMGTLAPEVQPQIYAILEPVQRIALQTVMKDPSEKDAVDPIIIPALVGRVLANLSLDQKLDIEKLLTTDEQRSAWEAVYRMRKLALGWQKEEYMLVERQREAAELAEKANGV